MSFFFRNSKKQVMGNNQKVIDNKNRDYYKKIIPGKKIIDTDLSKLYANLKEYQIYSPKCKTLKNSRN